MNQTLKKINQEKILFFDIEDIRRNKELDINSREFELFQKKTRNRETDEYLSDSEVVEEYSKKGALKMCYTRIVSIGVGFIKENEVHIKALEGTEEQIIQQFCTISQSFDYLCGANIIKFDLPMISNNGYRYFDVCEVLPDRFVVNGKKPWNIDRVIDLQEIFQGTHYSPSSVDEMCYHFNLPSPKTDLEGSKVSDEYWENGVTEINKYVKGDVFANVNLFKKMRFEQPFEDYIDKNSSSEPLTQEQSILKKLHSSKQFNSEVKNYLINSKIAKKDKPTVQKLVLAHYLEKVEVTAQNKKELTEVNKERTEQVKEFFKTL